MVIDMVLGMGWEETTMSRGNWHCVQGRRQARLYSATHVKLEAKTFPVLICLLDGAGTRCSALFDGNLQVRWVVACLTVHSPPDGTRMEFIINILAMMTDKKRP
jgi:hypothetical protein